MFNVCDLIINCRAYNKPSWGSEVGLESGNVCCSQAREGMASALVLPTELLCDWCWASPVNCAVFLWLQAPAAEAVPAASAVAAAPVGTFTDIPISNIRRVRRFYFPDIIICSHKLSEIIYFCHFCCVPTGHCSTTDAIQTNNTSLLPFYWCEHGKSTGAKERTQSGQVFGESWWDCGWGKTASVLDCQWQNKNFYQGTVHWLLTSLRRPLSILLEGEKNKK